jgi:hypothetical protein
VLVCFIGFLLPSTTGGDVPSGPEAGAKLDALNVSVAVGEKHGETIDAVAEREANPTIYLFVRADQFDRPMACVIKELDDACVQGVAGATQAAIVAVWITDTPEKSRDYLPIAQQSLKLQHTRWTVFEGGRNGPEKWALNDSAGLTVVATRAGKVVRSTGLTSWNETDVRRVLQSLKDQ